MQPSKTDVPPFGRLKPSATIPTILDPVTDALAERGLANLIFASGIWARASGGTTWSYPGIHCFASTVPRRAFNQAILNTSGAASDEDLREAVGRLAEMGLRYRVRLRDVAVDTLAPRLEALGLVNRGGIPAMVLNDDLPGASPNALRIESVTDGGRLLDMVRVVADAFEWEEGELGGVFRPSLTEEPDWHGWVGYEDGTPVAASQLVAYEGTGGLYYVAVLDAHRRKGYGEAITRIAIEAAYAAGCDAITLNASPHGYPVYKRLGFCEVGTHIGYTAADEDD